MLTNRQTSVDLEEKDEDKRENSEFVINTLDDNYDMPQEGKARIQIKEN